MSKEKKRVPRLRFGEFGKDGGNWILKSVSDLSNFTYGGGTPRTSVSEYWEGTIPWISSSDLKDDIVYNVLPSRYITKDAVANSATKLVPKNSIAVVTRVAVGKLSLIPFEYTTSQDFLSISNIKENELYTVYALYQLLQMQKNETQGTSIKGITKDELLAKKIYITTNLEEQEKIGHFLKTLDEMIQLQQLKINKVKDIKSAYLSEMFPKEGEKYPKRRFEGFTKPWIKKKVGEITNSYSGGTPSVGNSKYYTGNIPFIRSGEIYKDQTQLFINEISIQRSSAKMVTKGDILYALYGATSGEVAISKINGAINQAILALIPNSNCNAYFLAQYLNKEKNNILERYLQGGQGNLSGAIVKSIVIKLPEIKEQQKIGEFFKNLDTQIAIEEEKLAKLEHLKQAYLNDMFV